MSEFLTKASRRDSFTLQPAGGVKVEILLCGFRSRSPTLAEIPRIITGSRPESDIAARFDQVGAT